jgi:hypothetical protein
VKFPIINLKRTANTSMFIGHSKESDSGYDPHKLNRYDNRKRRPHRHMKSEDRFRKHKVNFTLNTCFKTNIKENSGLLNSPVRFFTDDKLHNFKVKREISKEPTFNIRPFTLECSSEATTSQSTRKPDSREKKRTNSDEIFETDKFQVENLLALCEKDETPKIKPALFHRHTKTDLEPLKLKIRYKNANLNRIKLKFKRKAGMQKLKNLDALCPDDISIDSPMKSVFDSIDGESQISPSHKREANPSNYSTNNCSNEFLEYSSIIQPNT